MPKVPEGAEALDEAARNVAAQFLAGVTMLPSPARVAAVGYAMQHLFMTEVRAEKRLEVFDRHVGEIRRNMIRHAKQEAARVARERPPAPPNERKRAYPVNAHKR